MKISFLSGKRLAFLLHIAAWTFLFILPIYLFTFDSNRDAFFIGRVYLRTLIYVLIFYLNYFWLIPKILFKGKKLYYYLITAALIVSLYIINDSVNKYIFEKPKFKPEREMVDKISKEFKMPNHPWRFDIYNFLFTSILISGFSIGLRMLDRYNENEKQRKDLEKERLNSELSFLKNQISPHFFFNTLNNIYSLVEINTGDAQKAILQLSKMMRYMLYESEQGNTLLSREITFMKNYIELMKLRITDKVNLHVHFPEEDTDIAIAPLLFIPFIENAFKHGVSNREPSFLDISMRVNQTEILFLCTNSIIMNGEINSTSDSGIGLENVRKRLSLLFPGKHQLSINQTSSAFEVILQINREQ
jgi:two-component system, LytTR family, sensor kinase